MKRVLFSIATALLSFAPALASAQIVHLTPEQACQVDSMCTRTFYKDSRQVRKPNADLMVYYGGTYRVRLPDGRIENRSMRDAIVAIAHKYQIDPVTLVLAPLAENTMNVQSADKMVDQMDDRGLMDDEGRILGRPFSIGPGQIYVHAAKRVESLAASIEGRAIRNSGEIKKQLRTPLGALKYAAALIRDAQDSYARSGKDISKRPEILTTLYNIGKVEKRLQKNRGQNPLPNYFGFWCGENYDYVRKTLNLPSTVYP